MPSYVTRAQKALIKKAYLLAEDAHKFQKRLSGEPYIIHPLAVAHTLADLGLDHEVVCAGLLHDVLEDTFIKPEYMRQEFGETITYLVESVTKISVLKTQTAENKQAINIRKMIMATIRDSRVILIKLADKLHNIRSLRDGTPEGWDADRIIGYVGWARTVVDLLRGTSAELEALFDAAVADLAAS